VNSSTGQPGKSLREPNFFIVGASRSGTTSMYYYLKQHPDVFMPAGRWEEKEPSFFCDLTPPWAIQYQRFDNYMGLFAGAREEKAVGEASANYLVSPESAGRIRKQFPNAKIIIILRHPVKRAYSLYKFMCSLGGEWISPFEKALAEEDIRYRNEDFVHNNPFYYYGYLYFHSGLYSEQIERYQSEFPSEQIHLVVFKELREHTIETVQAVYNFLGVRSDFIPKLGVYNRSAQPVSVRTQYVMLQKLRIWLTKARIPQRTVESVLGLGSRINLKLGKMFPRYLRKETYENLLERYEEDILKTKKLTKLDLDFWMHRA
jgi:hypothetical protein